MQEKLDQAKKIADMIYEKTVSNDIKWEKTYIESVAYFFTKYKDMHLSYRMELMVIDDLLIISIRDIAPNIKYIDDFEEAINVNSLCNKDRSEYFKKYLEDKDVAVDYFIEELSN